MEFFGVVMVLFHLREAHNYPNDFRNDPKAVDIRTWTITGNNAALGLGHFINVPAFSCIIWAMYRWDNTYDYAHLCSWSRKNFQWQGLCSHSALNEPVACSIDLNIRWCIMSECVHGAFSGRRHLFPREPSSRHAASVAPMVIGFTSPNP